MTLLPSEHIDDLLDQLRMEPMFIAGSAVAASVYDLPNGWSDIDVFVPTEQMLISTVRQLLDNGAVLDERFDRVWYRWRKFGLKGWHTNSMRMELQSQVEVNVVFKKVDGHPTTSLAQVLESFDFGLLGMGWDVERGKFLDLRPYLFPQYDIDGPLPLMPAKRDNWVHGFISQYNGIREGARYAKYLGYGYDLSLVKDDLVEGYRKAAKYHARSFDEDKQLLSQIYERLAELVKKNDRQQLEDCYRLLDYNDPLAQILEALE